MPYNLKNSVRHKFSRKHYNKRDWKSYEQGLRDRGSLTIWFSDDAISAWHPSPETKRKRGGQPQYTDLAIETAQTLRLIYNHPLRQTEGFMLSIVQLMGLDISIPDHTTISRRTETLVVSKKPSTSDQPVVVIVDSTGLKVFGEKEWMNHKHGPRQRKVWRKLHLCIDSSGEILSSTLTMHTLSDTSQVDDLLQALESPVDTFIGDGGYDNPDTYASLDRHVRHPITVIIPPNTGFLPERKADHPQRLENIHMIEDKGKIGWQAKMEYGRRAKVENTMHRYKSIIGNKLKSRNFEKQIRETQIAVQILNRMLKLGMSNAQKSA